MIVIFLVWKFLYVICEVLDILSKIELVKEELEPIECAEKELKMEPHTYVENVEKFQVTEEEIRKSCKYYSGNSLLKCAINPMILCADCRDFSQVADMIDLESL